MKNFRFIELTYDSHRLAITILFILLIFIAAPLHGDETNALPPLSDDDLFSDDLGAIISESIENSETPDSETSQSMSFYTDNQDGTVSAILTGLMWQKDDRHNDVKRDWKAANTYCHQLELAGYSDWRMPTRNELQSLVSPIQVNPSIDQKIFTGCKVDWYWLDSERDDDNADFIHFYNAREGTTHQSAPACVRCVRSDNDALE